MFGNSPKPKVKAGPNQAAPAEHYEVWGNHRANHAGQRKGSLEADFHEHHRYTFPTGMPIGLAEEVVAGNG